MKLLNVMIAEDNQMYRDGLTETLNDLPGVRVTGAAADGGELLQLVANDPPQVVFTDIRMPVMDGIAATRVLSQRYPEVKVLAITMYDDPHYLVQMLLAGARGYLSKEATEEEFAQALAAVGEGHCYYCPNTLEQMKVLLTDPRLPPLFRGGSSVVFTDLELSIIRLTCEGCQIKEIAGRLHLSTDMVKKYRNAIVRKVGARSWLGVVFFATKQGLIN